MLLYPETLPLTTASFVPTGTESTPKVDTMYRNPNREQVTLPLRPWASSNHMSFRKTPPLPVRDFFHLREPILYYMLRITMVILSSSPGHFVRGGPLRSPKADQRAISSVLPHL